MAITMDARGKRLSQAERRRWPWGRSRFDELEARLERLEARALQEWGPSSPPGAGAGAGFYAAFEDRFRGPRDLIRRRLAHYLPEARAAAREAPGSDFLDLGCGRGEWLELLGENGVPARGVDLDGRLLAAARERGLRVTEGDLLPCLAACPAATLAGVSAFHVVEHLPLPALLALLSESRRALRSGGLLLLETPNPENPVVGACDFWVDPTHRRPLPPALLQFLVSWAGFPDPVIVRQPATAPQLPADALGAAGEAGDGALRSIGERMRVPYDYAILARRGID